MSHHPTANPLREIVIGAAAGAGAALVMDRFQWLWSKYGSQIGLPGGSRQEHVESAPEDVAETAVMAVTGERLPAEQREAAGKAVHYATGAALGVAYGVLASSVRGSTLGGGLPLGAAAYLLLDQGLVPQLQLGDKAGQDSDDQKIYSLVSHLVFGVATDSFRRLLGAR
jgi:putative membrane protein